MVPFTLQQCDIVDGRPLSHTRCALWVLNQDRNGTLHPRAVNRPQRYPFEARSRITLDWIADRCFFALLLARLIELQVLPLAAETRAFVEGVEQWLADATTDDLGTVIRSRQPQQDVEERNVAALSRFMDQVDPDLTNPTWETAFFDALGGGTVDERWVVNVYWRRHQQGPIAQILEQLPRSIAGREVLGFDTGISPEAAAAVVRHWCDYEGRQPPPSAV